MHLTASEKWQNISKKLAWCLKCVDSPIDTPMLAALCGILTRSAFVVAVIFTTVAILLLFLQYKE